ncbi:hypothetical protein AGR1C_pAt20245 [Agrobacterium fabacearum TT111]|jgi:hypothetical protein|nr:hypothetical protein AGR1C_pAt20245 [Agrobacterium fabacearum TT111]
MPALDRSDYSRLRGVQFILGHQVPEWIDRQFHRLGHLEYIRPLFC